MSALASNARLFAALAGSSQVPGVPPVTPNAGDLPGVNLLKSITDGLEGWALLAALVGIVVGVVLWAFGHYSQNPHQAYNGRKGVLVSILAALLIGAAPYLVKFFFGQGSTL